MGKIIELRKHSSLLLVDDVKIITAPLLASDTNYFCFVRIFKDRSRICLTNCGEWHNHFCNQKKYLRDAFELPIESFSSGHIAWSPTINNDIAADLFYNFGVLPTVTIVEKDTEYCDFYHYGTSAKNNVMFDATKHLQQLEHFVFCFKEKANKLINKSQLITFPEWQTPENIKIETASNVKLPDVKRYVFDHDNVHTYFTRKELECIKLVAVGGKSCEEISDILSISRRTVETHLDNAKRKLNCSRLPQLTYKIASSRLYSKLLEEIYWL